MKAQRSPIGWNRSESAELRSRLRRRRAVGRRKKKKAFTKFSKASSSVLISLILRSRRFHRRGGALIARARWGNCSFRWRGGVQPQSRDSLASGDQIQCAAPGVHQQNGPRRRGLCDVGEEHSSKAWRERVAGLLPLGREDQLRGQLDVINKKAIIYSDSDQLDLTYEVADVPEDMSISLTKRITIW